MKIYFNIRDDIAGRWRRNNEWVRVGDYIAPAPDLIIGELEKMFSQYQAGYHKHMVKRIALFHLQFEHIHPFMDGNGRIGRALNNYLLIREGFVPINIKLLTVRNTMMRLGRLTMIKKPCLWKTLSPKR